MAMIKCKECRQLISSKASNCPHCGAPNKAPTSLFTWLVLGVVVVVAFNACSGSGRGGNSTASSEPKCDATMAHIMAGNFVKERLKAPTTAKFPYTNAAGVSITPLGDCRFAVVSYVDSQNGFGAMIRSRFSATMTSTPDGKTWRAADLVIE